MARWQPAEREARFVKARRAGRPVVVTEGDSWFDYPMYLNVIDRIDDAKRFALKRLEFSGDTVANMIGHGPRFQGLAALKTVVENERPRLVLFSGGGNDIVGNELTGAIKAYDPTKTAEWHLDTAIWRQLSGAVRDGYEVLVREIGPLAPIFAHGYDHIVPVNRGARYDGWSVAGPWVWPEMEAQGIPDPMKVAIGRAMINWFNDMLANLETAHRATGYFGHIDLRGTLRTEEWENEIHPTKKGFKLIAERLLQQLDVKITTVIPVHDAVALGAT